MQFPAYMYHATENPILVRNQAELEALGPDWADSPAAFGVITHPSLEQQRQATIAAASSKRKNPKKDE